jgi:hypothetical protein
VAPLGLRLRVVNAIRSIKHGLQEPGEDPTGLLTDALEGVATAGTDTGGAAEGADGTTDEQPVGALEAITSPAGGLEDPRAVIQSLRDAMWRTALIEIDGVPRGTGFLVGPNLLLTAAHVIDPRQWPPVPRPDVVACFDYILDATASLRDTGVRVPVAEFVTASLPTPGEVAGNVREWEAPAGNLDFALLRLAHDVPPVDEQGLKRARGDYALDPGDYDFARSPMLFIVQHPLGSTQRVTWVRSPAQPNTLGTRIRYGGNTLNGSSGSAVVDPRGRLVAVHHYSAPGRNQAVPVSRIRQTLDAGDFGRLFTHAPNAPAQAAAQRDIDPFATTLLAGRAFVNRTDLRDHLRRMAVDDDANRLLTIEGESGSGMSYSYRLLSHVSDKSRACEALRKVAPEGLTVVPLDLSDYVAFDAGERAGLVVRDLLEDLGLTHPGDAWAQISRNAAALGRVLRRGLRDSERQWWVFVDGIEELVAIKQGGLDEVIHALATVADDPAVPLRLVLVGQDAAAFAAEHGLVVAEDTATGLVRQHVQDWFTERAKATQSVLDQARVDRVLDELFPVGGPLPAPAVLEPRLPQRLLELLGAGDGS